MCIKLDLGKAFDSISREFICDMLLSLGFDGKWIKWLKACMNPSFALQINGERSQIFPSTNGIRQGDPLSPYLFLLAMQVLSSLFRKAEECSEIDPIACGSVTVSHIIFTDDVMIFLQVDKKNARNLKRILDQFSSLSGMNINYGKSAIFYGGSVQHRSQISSHLRLSQGELPIRYLGFPLISKRLSVGACSPLIQAIMQRLQSWKARLLSFTGRAELIKSVLSAMHLYWLSVFNLPVGVHKEIDKLLLGFLWYGLGPKKNVFISWKNVCQPKEEGALSI